MKLIKKRRINKKIIMKFLALVGAGTLTIISMNLLNSTKLYRIELENSMKTINTQIVELQQEQESIKQELADIDQTVQNAQLCTLETVSCNDWREVLFTNYFYGDGSSGKTTASGLKTADFKVVDGMYTYQDKVVLATANTTRYKRNLKDGYRSHELYEELTIEVNNKQYQAIVLDVCGACYGVQGEQYQRYDIFTVGSVIGLQKGKINE